MSSGANLYAEDVLNICNLTLQAREKRIQAERDDLIFDRLGEWEAPGGWRLLFPKKFPKFPPTVEEVVESLRVEFKDSFWCSTWGAPRARFSDSAGRVSELRVLAEKALAHARGQAFVFLTVEDCGLLGRAL